MQMRTNLLFWIDGKQYAGRSNVSAVPRVGERIWLKDKTGGTVSEVIWQLGVHDDELNVDIHLDNIIRP